MKYKVIVTILALSLFSLLAYQNCGQRLGDLNEKVNASSDTDAFPYELSVDTLAHMSCEENAARPDLFFTFKLLSLVKASPANKIYISREHKNSNNIKDILDESDKIKNALLHFSMRDAGETKNSIEFDSPLISTEKTIGIDLNSKNIKDWLGFVKNYSLEIAATLDLRLNGSVIDYADAFNLGDISGTKYALHLGAIKDFEPENKIISPEGEESGLHAYGNTYFLQFTNAGSLSQKRILSSVTEKALMNSGDIKQKTRQNSWHCQEYLIVKKDDDEAFCNNYTKIIENTSNPIIKDLYKVLGSDWEYSSGSGSVQCVRPLIAGCYPTEAKVSYSYHNACGEGQIKHCPHFLNICTKNVFDSSY